MFDDFDRFMKVPNEWDLPETICNYVLHTNLLSYIWILVVCNTKFSCSEISYVNVLMQC